MKFFKKNKGSSKQKAQQDSKAVPSTPTKYSNNNNNNNNNGTKKKIKSPLKKIKGLFRKKKAPEQKCLTLLSPDVHAEASRYYSNNTDGFEVILEGHNIQYEENPNKEPPRKPLKICGVEASCAPLSALSDWDNFVSVLSGNFNLFGQEENDLIAAPVSASTRRNANHGNAKMHVKDLPPFQKIVTDSKNREEALPFDEQAGAGAQERSAIETTLEHEQQSKDETMEIHPFKRKNDRPISNILRNKDIETETANPAESAEQHNEAIEFPSFELPEEDVPDEEIYDTTFTLKFLKEVSNIGIILTYFQVPEDGREMSSRVVNLTIKPGLARGSRLLEPKLCWQDLQNKRGPVTAISLLGIHSIQTTLDPDEDNNPFFTVTTNDGDVHAFESPTLSERNYIVHGIKNVVAWLSYHLVTGNMATGTKLTSDFDEERGESIGELPSLKTPVQAMNEMSHAFLD